MNKKRWFVAFKVIDKDVDTIVEEIEFIYGLKTAVDRTSDLYWTYITFFVDSLNTLQSIADGLWLENIPVVALAAKPVGP